MLLSVAAKSEDLVALDDDTARQSVLGVCKLVGASSSAMTIWPRSFEDMG